MNIKDDYLSEYFAWRSHLLDKVQFECRPIPFGESKEWFFENGILRHRTGGFFALAGIRAAARLERLNDHEQLIILQHDPALNGFLLRRRGGHAEILFQARAEPGNVGGIHLAPTVQSTATNYRRLHGGAPTPMVEWFLDAPCVETVFDELQSEEGTRYHGKYNRNIVRDVGDREVEIPDNFRWYGLDALRQFAIADNVLNTDSRSVLACVDWRLLADDDRPFAHHAADSRGAQLRDSYETTAGDRCECSLWDLHVWLCKKRAWTGLRTHVLPLDALRNWVVEDDRIRERTAHLGFMARQFHVTALGREVQSWDQPLIDSAGIGCIVLVCQERKGLLHFLVRAAAEVGFLEGVQLSSTVMIAPGESPRPVDGLAENVLMRLGSRASTDILATCRQSEEGGRFYQDENQYAIVAIDAGVELPRSDDYRWVTLGQIRELVKAPGMLAMELRGILPMLFRWL